MRETTTIIIYKLYWYDCYTISGNYRILTNFVVHKTKQVNKKQPPIKPAAPSTIFRGRLMKKEAAYNILLSLNTTCCTHYQSWLTQGTHCSLATFSQFLTLLEEQHAYWYIILITNKHKINIKFAARHNATYTIAIEIGSSAIPAVCFMLKTITITNLTYQRPI